MRIAPELASPSSAKAWREFLDVLADAVLVIDGGARIAFANTAALRVMPVEPGTPLAQLEGALGGAAVRWLAKTVAAQREPGPPPLASLADGRAATLSWRKLDARHSALRLHPDPGPRTVARPELPSDVDPAVHAGIHLFWDSPFPAILQGSDFRIVDVNAAFLAFSGYAREQLLGRDPLEFLPDGERVAASDNRRHLVATFGRTEVAALSEGRMLDANGRERWFRVARRVVGGTDGQTWYLALLQDTTAERAARERADRSVRELDDWFDLSPTGMVLFDHGGLLVRTNPAFDALVGRVPVMLKEAPASLRQLLAWEDGAPHADLVAGAPPVERRGWVPQPGGEVRRLRAIVRAYQTAGGPRRYMAAVEDRSVEEERDLAQMQIGALIDTAGVGLATFQESSGWVRQRQGAAPLGGVASGPSAALQSISRELVVAESLPEYEKLQSALRQAQRAEVRYAIDHPELGRRWLLTRVEPATLASGQRTTSIVTLDVTEQQKSAAKSEQLLHEMTTILESTSAGIAFLRGDRLVRCNRRFESMLALEGRAVPGARLVELLARHTDAERLAVESLAQVAVGRVAETELEVVDADGTKRWYALALRGAGVGGDPAESIAVLSDVTRLKTQQLQLEILARDRELMFSLSEVGIAFVRDRRLQRANQALAELTGWSVEDLSALELSALYVDPSDFKRRWAEEERDMRQHGRWSGERQLRRRDGRLVWVQVSQRLVNRDHPAGGFIASYVDVDARHRAERAVSLQAERTRSILDSVLVGIVHVGPHGIEWMNRSARRMLGGDLADFVGEPISIAATDDPEHPFRRTAALERLPEGESETFECRVRARDGRESWIVGNAVVTDRDTTGRQLTFALLDIERRRQAEARMTEAQSALQQVIAAAPLAIALLEAKTMRVVQVNAVAAASLGRRAEDLAGRAPEDIFEPRLAAVYRRDMQRALGRARVAMREYRVHDAAGRARVWDARYVPIGASGGARADQLLLVATDVTEQRAAQQARLEAAIAQREMLVKEVHHRIKNNLQGVAGLLQQIAERKPEVASAIGEVVGQVQAIAQVYGLQVGAPGPLRVDGVVEAIVSSVQRTFGHAIRRTSSGGDEATWALPESEAIPIALTLNELLTNAVKHSEAGEGARADIACELIADAGGIRVSISNPARLADGFDLGLIPGGVSGLGLVRALLPRRHATLGIEQHGRRVVATMTLQPPVLARASDAA
ncbi:MAG TPA: PAS domain S-box protein [Caldimonas sp.]|nr:PAS domain S-box protein [Caldimonas sp.]